MKFLINNVTTNWKEFIEHEFSLPYLNNIDQKLFEISLEVLPKTTDIFRAFNFFDVEQTKLVIFGQDPYHQPGVADGLAFSTKYPKIPPSLNNLFKKLAINLSINRTNPDLTEWAQQGILLLNTALTVTAHKPNSHHNWGWINFVIACIQFLNTNCTNIVFLLLGNNAQTLSKYIDQNRHVVMCRAHPSPLAQNKIFTQNLFDELNTLLVTKKFCHIKW